MRRHVTHPLVWLQWNLCNTLFLTPVTFLSNGLNQASCLHSKLIELLTFRHSTTCLWGTKHLRHFWHKSATCSRLEIGFVTLQSIPHSASFGSCLLWELCPPLSSSNTEALRLRRSERQRQMINIWWLFFIYWKTVSGFSFLIIAAIESNEFFILPIHKKSHHDTLNVAQFNVNQFFGYKKRPDNPYRRAQQCSSGEETLPFNTQKPWSSKLP